MSGRAAAALGLALIGCSVFGASGAASRKKPQRSAVPSSAPRVNTAMRAAALRKVSDYLAEVPPQVLAQPGALVPIFEQLARLSSGQAPSSIHIIHFGDSHTAADEWTGGLRDLFKERFGDGGSGFSLAGHPFLGYRRFDARGGGTSGWRSDGFRSASPGDGFLGLGGMSITAEHAGESVFLDADCSHLEVHYLQQPGGGDLGLFMGDQFLDRISTDGELGPGFVRYQTPSGPHRFRLETLNARPVRLFGWVADKPNGLTYEALGINGAEAAVMMKWDEKMLATYLQRRDPGLIVLAYGTNEASDPNWTPEAYHSMFSALLQRLRRSVPAASILVVGPADRWYRVTRSGWFIYPGIDWVIAAERAACRENGVAFWDARQRMGGKGSMRDWVYAGLAQNDFVHFTSAGYRRLAEVLFGDLMRQYDAYKKSRLEITDQAAHGQANQNR